MTYFLSTGPIASIFWLDEELCSEIFLDGELIMTVPFQMHMM